jgi:hypothetical protein
MLEKSLPINIRRYSPLTRFMIRYFTVFIGFTILAFIGFIPIAMLYKLTNPNEAIELISILGGLDKEIILPYLGMLIVLTTKWHLDSEREPN